MDFGVNGVVFAVFFFLNFLRLNVECFISSVALKETVNVAEKAENAAKGKAMWANVIRNDK